MIPPWIEVMFWNCLAIVMLSVTACFVIATAGICFKLFEQWKGYK